MPAVWTLSKSELAAVLTVAPSLRQQDVLIYDGQCRFCIAQVARLQRFAGPKLDKLPLQTPELLAQSGIEPQAAMSAMHLLTSEGRVYRGLEAAVQALRHRAVLGRLARLYYVPGLRQLCNLGYRLVARYRYALMGRAVARGECDGACALHLPPPRSEPRTEKGAKSWSRGSLD